MKTLSFNINGKKMKASCHPFTRLLDILRENFHLTGTKEGCGEGECGACSVILDGQLVNSCLVPAIQADGKKVLTVEGLSKKSLSPLQKSFIECGGAQCGICTPGMLIAAQSLKSKRKKINKKEIREVLAGNLCRCTGYSQIIKSVESCGRKS